MRGELKPGQPHPAAQIALRYLSSIKPEKLFVIAESFASCAIEGNEMAEVCSETMDRLLNHKPMSDRYLMGLAWAVWDMENERP